MMTIPDSQQAIVISAPGGPEVLTLAIRPVPRPGAGEVLVEVVAAGVNRHDCDQRKAGPRHEPNPVPGLKVAGRIVACGASASRSADRRTDGGGYGAYAIAPAGLALPRPRDT